MKSAGRARLLAPGGAVIAGFVLCLLLTAVYGNPPTRRIIKATPANISVALNNSVVASASIQDRIPPSEAPCTGDDCAAGNKSSEELLPAAKGPVTSGDPLVRTNHIGLARYAAGSVADEIEERVRADIANRPSTHVNNYTSAATNSGNSYSGDNSSRSEADDIEDRVRADIANRYEFNNTSSASDHIPGRYGSNNDSAKAADDIEKRIRLDIQDRPSSGSFSQRPSVSTFEDRLRRLSVAVNHNIDSGIKDASTSSSSTPSIEIQSAESESVGTEHAGTIWLVPSGTTTEETPGLPNKYSRVAGFISTMSYDQTADPSKYRLSSTKTMEDGTATAFTSTNSFTFSESIKPSIAPTSVTLVLTTSGSYDNHDSGSTVDDDYDEDEEAPKIKEAATIENKEKIISTNNNTIVHGNDTITAATNTSINILNFNETGDVKNVTGINLNNSLSDNKQQTGDSLIVEDLLNSNKTEINSKLLITEKEVQNKKENESLNKNLTTEPSSTRGDESMTSSVVTMSQSMTTRRRQRPTSTTTAEPISSQEAPSTVRSLVASRGNTKFGSSTTDTVRTSTPENSTTKAPFVPSATTFRGRTSTRRGSTSASSTTTPIPDAVGAESTMECTSTEETSETTLTPEEEGNTVTYRTSVRSRTTLRSSTKKGPTTIRGRYKSQEPANDTTTSPLTEVTWSTNTTEWEELSTLEPGTNTEISSESTSSSTSSSPSDTTASPAGDDDEYHEASTEPTLNFTSSPTHEENTIPQETEFVTTLSPNVKAFLRLTVATSWEELCRDQDVFRQDLAALLTRGTGRDISSDRVVLLNEEQCLEPPDSTPAGIPLHVYLKDEKGHYDMQLTELFPQVWGKDTNNDLQITCVDLRYTKDEQVAPATAENANVIAAIAISGVAAGCLLLLVILMLVMRKRQKRTTYGQRCTPVSLDAYSLDSVSVYNSVRRKGHLRASKRSYGNPAFDDTDSPSHPVNFAGIANCVGDLAALHEEFALVPVVPARMDDLPPGADAKNRYSNVIPLPETRVPLTRKSSDPLTEYINASYVRGPKNAPKYYIACQAPLESTVSDFWRMIWEQQSKVILMLTDLEENGAEKCADYLPPSEVLDCHRRFGDFHLTLKKREVRDKYIVSTLQLKNMETSLWREITHLWFFGWPATGVPEEASAVIAFIIEARAFMKNNPGPNVVHCSPGTGRTGTVLACDLCIRDFEQSRLVDVPRVVSRLRRDRAGAVQTRDQYVFIYQVLNLYAAKLTGGAMDSF